MDELADLMVSNVSKNGITFCSVALKADGSLPDPLPCDYVWSLKIPIMDKSW